MIETQSPERAFIHEAIDHVANLGYLTLPERRVLLRNCIKVLRQSQNIDSQSLPPDDQAELRTAPKFITTKELSLSAQVSLVVSPKKVSNRKFCRKVTTLHSKSPTTRAKMAAARKKYLANRKNRKVA